MEVEDMGLQTNSEKLYSAGYTLISDPSPSKSPPLNKRTRLESQRGFRMILANYVNGKTEYFLTNN